MAGVLRPQQGTIAFDGRALAAIPRRELARHIAVVPQETHPAFDYSVLEMVLMGRHPHLRTFELEGPDDLAIAYDALGATGTAHLAARSYMSLRSASSLPARSRSSPTCCCSTSRLPHSISRTSSRWRHSSAG